MNTKKINWLHVAISWGASVVIAGAMFKINHWGGHFGTYMIGLGLAVEALLFFTLGFFPPAKDPEWERVYPQLSEDFKGESLVSAQLSTGSNTQAFDKMLAQNGLDESNLSLLTESIKKFADKLLSIDKTVDITFEANSFGNKLSQASAKFDLLSMAFEHATQGFNAIAESSKDAKAYQEQISALSGHLTQLNKLYESELSGADDNLRKINRFYNTLGSTLESLNNSAEENKTFKDEMGKLTKNVSSLNLYYANMLSVMTQPKF